MTFMKRIGIICEFNPLHNGHIYYIEQIKQSYPDSLIILVLGSYFLQRGEPSLISKYNKTKISLDYGIDLVLELPVLYNTNSADFFAYHAIKILNEAKIDILAFGSESCNLNLLQEIADKQQTMDINKSIKTNLKKGLNYPTSLSKSLDVNLESNDILSVSYIKAIKKINNSITPHLIKRTNKYNDTTSTETIISASNIRERLKNKKSIKKFIPNYPKSLINKIDYNKLFELLKYKILTDNHLNIYLGVDEGIENKLKKEILKVNSYEELLEKIKSKRYTTSRLKRMLTHILLGIEKSDMKETQENYIILGFNKKGREYLKFLKSTKLTYKSDDRISSIEKTSSLLYYELTKDKSVNYDFLNKPIIKK